MKIIALTCGDLKGIGIEIIFKEWKKGRIKNFVLFSNIQLLKKIIKNNKNKFKLNLVNIDDKVNNYSKDSINVYNYKVKNHADNTYKSLEYAYKYTKLKKFIGIVTLPINKKIINDEISKNFIDQTSFFAKKEKKITNMIFVYKNNYFIPLSIHIPITKVNNFIKKKILVYKKIKILNSTLKKDFKIKKPKLYISGMNPHAGEEGLIGDEEIKYLNPVINQLRKDNILIKGPFSADSILNKKLLNNHNAFIFIFHDQALIPFKLISEYSGINFTSNLNVIRVSPDHGTAYSEVGKGKASPKGILNSFKIIKKIYQNRYK